MDGNMDMVSAVFEDLEKEVRLAHANLSAAEALAKYF